ncbi:MAG: hypothetical protein ABS52_19485 [Gemmatimonadetes bacterium SCN 70-22]|nr:MAG: hypothetical protein ABS52_19485 [Gemmatimonadetes bacterium SCN 70-22]
MIDLSNPEQVKAEAERRARLRAAGKPLTADGGLARLTQTLPVPPLLAPRASAENTERTDMAPPLDVSIGAPPVAWRRGDTLWLMIPATARPKKNSTRLGIKKSPGYIRFKNAVIGAVRPFARQLRLPLPPIDFNCAAHFYRERDDADTDNLITGLADALQDAGVLEDDFRLRTWNGTDRFLDVTRPRVELTLTPYVP